MGNCCRPCRHNFFDDNSEYDFPIRFLRPGFFPSIDLESLSSFDSYFTRSTLNEPSILSFKNGNSNDQVFVDGETCIICLEKYDDTEHIPVILPCGHMLCVVCTKVLARKRRYKSVKCPIDRLKHDIKSKKDRLISETKTNNNRVHIATQTTTVNSLPPSNENLTLRIENLSVHEQYLRTRVQNKESWYVDGWVRSLISPRAYYHIPRVETNSETLDSIQHNFCFGTDTEEPPPDYTPVSTPRLD